MTVIDRTDGQRIAAESGDEVRGDGDFLGNGLDAVDRWSTPTPSKAHGFAFDQQGSAPNSVGLGSLERALETACLQRAGATDRLRTGHIKIIVGEEEVGEGACAVRASSSTFQRHECWRRIESDGEARCLRFIEHKVTVRTHRQRSVAQSVRSVTHCFVPVW